MLSGKDKASDFIRISIGRPIILRRFMGSATEDLAISKEFFNSNRIIFCKRIV